MATASSSPVSTKLAAREDRRLLLRYHREGDLRERRDRRAARELGLKEEEVLEAFEAARAYDSLSLDASRAGGEDSEDSRFGDALGEEDACFELVELGATIAPALRELPDRDRRILYLRFVEDLTSRRSPPRSGSRRCTSRG